MVSDCNALSLVILSGPIRTEDQKFFKTSGCLSLYRWNAFILLFCFPYSLGILLSNIFIVIQKWVQILETLFIPTLLIFLNSELVSSISKKSSHLSIQQALHFFLRSFLGETVLFFKSTYSIQFSRDPMVFQRQSINHVVVASARWNPSFPKTSIQQACFCELLKIPVEHLDNIAKGQNPNWDIKPSRERIFKITI